MLVKTPQIERIQKMEQLMDDVIYAMNHPEEENKSINAKVEELKQYYSSALWIQDYTDDEAGNLPANLKRGVLSEDGLFNLLSDYEERQKENARDKE